MTSHGDVNLLQDLAGLRWESSGADRTGESRPNEVAYASIGPGTHEVHLWPAPPHHSTGQTTPAFRHPESPRSGRPESVSFVTDARRS